MVIPLLAIVAGTPVTVLAPWANGAPVKARIVSHFLNDDGTVTYTVSPTEGNPHHRWVSPEHIQDRDLLPTYHKGT